MNLFFARFKSKMKGLFSISIPYTPLLESGDSSPYFGTYEGQKYGSYDTNCCWDFSSCELVETRLEMLMKMNLIPQESLNWLQENGYIDSDGDFYLSRRWVAIMSGVKDNGNYQLNFWKLASQVGLIPNSMLPFSLVEAQQWLTKDQFNNDYFNPNVITPQMREMGQEFLKRFSIQAEPLSGGYLNDISVDLQTYLKEGSIQIGIPVPQDGSWNNQLVHYPIGRTISDHAVELYRYDESQDYPFYIYDSYQPHLKQLSKNYYIPIITRVSIKPVNPLTLPQFNPWMKFWFNVKAWMLGRPIPFPDTPVGSLGYWVKNGAWDV